MKNIKVKIFSAGGQTITLRNEQWHRLHSVKKQNFLYKIWIKMETAFGWLIEKKGLVNRWWRWCLIAVLVFSVAPWSR